MPAEQFANYVFPIPGFSGPVQNHWGAVRGGSDLFAARGTPVQAMRGGTVIEAGYNSVGGNSVLIQGDDGNQYYYAHFDKAPAVRVGQAVQPGTYLGPVGDTGDAKGTGTHLHIGIGPTIRLGADKYGGTGGDYDAVGLLQHTLAGNFSPMQQQPNQDPFAGFDQSNPYVQMTAKAAQSAGIDPKIFLRQINQESHFNPNAGSPKGARGIAQIVPQYHPGVNVNDPQASLTYSANLMAKLLEQYHGDWRQALTAYNGGQGAVSALNSGRPYDETKVYLQEILQGDSPIAGPIQPGANNVYSQIQQPAMRGGLFGKGPIVQMGGKMYSPLMGMMNTPIEDGVQPPAVPPGLFGKGPLFS